MAGKKQLLLYLALAASLLGNFLNFSTNKTTQDRGKFPVVKVIDGDSFALNNGQLVRLLGIDAPEIGFCGGEAAKTKLESLINGQAVILTDILVDNYRRILALVYVDDTLINDIMVREGWGRYEGKEHSQRDKLKQSSDYARTNRLGIYGPECYQTENLDQPKCLIKGNISQSNVKTYFLPTCGNYSDTVVEKYKGDQWFCTEAEARAAGFTKSVKCAKTIKPSPSSQTSL